MEDTHGDTANAAKKETAKDGLNPYYNGRYSWRTNLWRLQSLL